MCAPLPVKATGMLSGTPHQGSVSHHNTHLTYQQTSVQSPMVGRDGSVPAAEQERRHDGPRLHNMSTAMQGPPPRGRGRHVARRLPPLAQAALALALLLAIFPSTLNLPHIGPGRGPDRAVLPMMATGSRAERLIPWGRAPVSSDADPRPVLQRW
jgi:hypothetical protein